MDDDEIPERKMAGTKMNTLVDKIEKLIEAKIGNTPTDDWYTGRGVYEMIGGYTFTVYIKDSSESYNIDIKHEDVIELLELQTSKERMEAIRDAVHEILS